VSEIGAALADGVLDPLARLLNEMRAAGVADPPRVVRDALAAGENAVTWPLLAWGAGLSPVAIMWAPEAQIVLVVANVVGDVEATGRAIGMALDVVALHRDLAVS
jgi:hypothetical protein